MSGSSDDSRSLLLDRLNKEASVPLDTADAYSIRAWLTSAKKCLDQVRYVFLASARIEIVPRTNYYFRRRKMYGKTTLRRPM